MPGWAHTQWNSGAVRAALPLAGAGGRCVVAGEGGACGVEEGDKCNDSLFEQFGRKWGAHGWLAGGHAGWGGVGVT